MKVLLTGAFGFIGLHVLLNLLRTGYHVRVLGHNPHSSFTSSEFSYFHNGDLLTFEYLDKKGKKTTKKVELILGDIRNKDVCKESCKGMNAVIHLAGIASISLSVKDPVLATEVNVGGTKNLLNASVEAGVKRFVFASTAKIYGSQLLYPSKEEQMPYPETPYALTKFTGEKYCESFHKDSGIEVVSLRFFSVYGPHQKLNYGYVGTIIESICNDRSPILTGNSHIERDFTYIDDAVSIITKSLKIPNLKNEIFNVGSGLSHTVQQVVDIINHMTGKNIKPEYVSLLPGVAIKTLADLTKAKNVLGFSPSTDLETGLKKTLLWYCQDVKNGGCR